MREGQRDPERTYPPCQVTQKGKTTLEVALGKAQEGRVGLEGGCSKVKRKRAGERWRGWKGEGCGHQVAKVPMGWRQTPQHSQDWNKAGSEPGCGSHLWER